MIEVLDDFLTKYNNKSLEVDITSKDGFTCSYLIKKFGLYGDTKDTMRISDNKNSHDIVLVISKIENVEIIGKYEAKIKYNTGTIINLKQISKRVKESDRFAEVNNGLHVFIHEDEWGNTVGSIRDNP